MKAETQETTKGSMEDCAHTTLVQLLSMVGQCKDRDGENISGYELELLQLDLEEVWMNLLELFGGLGLILTDDPRHDGLR